MDEGEPSGRRQTRADDTVSRQSSNQQLTRDTYHDPSYLDLRRRLASPHGGGPAPISEEEVEKAESFHDSSSTLSSASDESRPGRRGFASQPPRMTRSVSQVRDGIESRHELDLGSLSELEKQPTPRDLANENLVTWDRDDPDNPKTWSMGRKWAAVVTVSLFTLISPVSSSMTAPALDYIGADLHITSEFEKELSLSIFVLGGFPGPRGGCWSNESDANRVL